MLLLTTQEFMSSSSQECKSHQNANARHWDGLKGHWHSNWMNIEKEGTTTTEKPIR